MQLITTNEIYNQNNIEVTIILLSTVDTII